MKRRTFLWHSALFSACLVTAKTNPAEGKDMLSALKPTSVDPLYEMFQNPAAIYKPFVRWWWNGNKVEAGELIRELHLLKEAGIGGVEINPISFPTTGDDLGKKSLTWLSDEWIDLLQLTFSEAGKLDMTCDLIVGSGWPFGAETLKKDERAQVVLVATVKLKGPVIYETSKFNLFKTVDPEVTVPNPSRTFGLLSLKLVPEPLSSLSQVTDLECRDEIIRVAVPEGNHCLYALVKVDSFASVINGAPGASGHILNHMDQVAVRNYLYHMSDTIQKKTGPLAGHLRSLFTDSMELEGSNWTSDIAEAFRKRRGYDIMPYLPFILFRVGRLGGVVDDKYGAVKAPEFIGEIARVRFDFELTKAELLHERFTMTYLQWCRDLQVKSRAQAYGRGFFPLESSLGYDIPEGESWTTNWLKHRIGEEMSDEDYRRGRAYTMINKFVSSAAHLTGKRVVSCEEMTNTYTVFNETPELLKIGSDQSILSGVTHTIWSGYNYSPPGAPFPGWIQYGSFYHEDNNWWPHFKLLNRYKARLSSLLQNTGVFTDMAILPATYDLWGDMGVQTDPFPEKLNIPYTSLLWESIHRNGGAADYISETIIRNSKVGQGKLCFGNKKYGTLFLAGVTGVNPEILPLLYDFVSRGGRIFCIDKCPEKSLGLNCSAERDQQVQYWVEKLKAFPGRFILLKKPADNCFLEWYQAAMTIYNLPHYLEIENPDRFVMQNRYQSDIGTEIIFFSNTHLHNSHTTRVTFSDEITKGRYGWIWDPETGERYRIHLKDGHFEMELGPAESRLFVFNGEKTGREWIAIPATGAVIRTLQDGWETELHHSREKWVKTIPLNTPADLKENGFADFTGTIVYRLKISTGEFMPDWLNLGKVWGISEVLVNGLSCGIKWYGNRIYKVTDFMQRGSNLIEVRVTTTMGNYMKTLTGNPTAQKWTVLANKNQPIQPMGMVGPVTIYKSVS
jgi:hypothetical protein